MILENAPVTYGGRCERHLQAKPCGKCAEEAMAQARLAEAQPLPNGPLELLRFLQARFDEVAYQAPGAQRLARHIEAMLNAFPQDAEFTPKDYEDAQRYQFLSLEGVMWFGGEKCFRSSHMLDRMVDRARHLAENKGA